MNFKQRTYHFLIRGDDWKILVMSPKCYDKKFGTDSKAITYTETKTVIFNTDFITEKIVKHELFHVFVSYLYHTDADISVDQFEEMCATFMEDKADEYIETCQDVFKKINKHKTEELVKVEI